MTWTVSFKLEYQQNLIFKITALTIFLKFFQLPNIYKKNSEGVYITMYFKVMSFLTEFNLLLIDLNNLIRNSSPLLNSNQR